MGTTPLNHILLVLISWLRRLFTYGVLRRIRSIHQHRYQVAHLAFLITYGVCFLVALGTVRRRYEFEDEPDKISVEKMSENLEWTIEVESETGWMVVL